MYEETNTISYLCVIILLMFIGEKMEEFLLHGRLHATIYEIDALHATQGGRSGFLGKVLSQFIRLFLSTIKEPKTSWIT